MHLFNLETAKKFLPKWYEINPAWSRIDACTFFVASSRFNIRYAVSFRWKDGEVYAECQCPAKYPCYHMCLPGLIFRSPTEFVSTRKESEAVLTNTTEGQRMGAHRI